MSTVQKSPGRTRTVRFERPGRALPRLREIKQDMGSTYALNAFIGVIFSVSGPIAVVLAVGAAGNLSDAQLASWVFGIFLSGGLATLVMSLIYRQPLGFAWSIPGTVLLGPSLQHLSFPEIVGAFFTAGILILALGASGVVRRAMSAVPMPIVMAMVAAMFLRFGTDIVDSARAEPWITLPMVAVFILLLAVPALGSRIPAVLGAFVVGLAAVTLTGQFSVDGSGPLLAAPVFTTPEFTWAAQLELVVPLMITVLVVQNGQGTAVLRSAGHNPPINVSAITSGAFSMVNAAFGAVSACLTGPTNALLTASGERHRQYIAGLFYGVMCIVCALFAPPLTRLLLGTPEAFILALGGLAMFKALQQSFVTAFSTRFTLGSLVTFVVTVSGLDLFNIHAAFWGIVLGYIVSRILEADDHAALREEKNNQEHQ